MDNTALGIIAGLSFTAAYEGLRLYKRRPFDLSVTGLIFLASVTLPGGWQMIKAAVLGDLASVPTSTWREYVAAAGVIAIGMCVSYIGKSFRKLLANTSRAVRTPEIAEGDTAVNVAREIKSDSAKSPSKL
jgi:hypothetical protein